MANIAANVKRLCELKDITPAQAKEIRAVWCKFTRAELKEKSQAVRDLIQYTNGGASLSTRRMRMACINAIFDSHGIEYLGLDRRTNDDVYYCNAGDTYAPTIIFRGRVLSVGCWGDLIERNAIREVQS
jgi:hypothetical protein